MNNIETTIQYAVNDLGLASALVCKKIKLLDLAPNPDSERVTFYFETNRDLEALVQSYWSGELKVDAKTFWQEMKNLKSRLYNLYQ